MCIAASDPTVSNLEAYAKQLVTAAPGSMQDENRVRYDLPLIADTAVAIVSDSTICAAAARAYAVARPSADTVAVGVVRIGSSRFIVWDGGHTKAGEFEIYIVFDNTFTRLHAFGS
jgi:hypothetical protein